MAEIETSSSSSDEVDSSSEYLDPPDVPEAELFCVCPDMRYGLVLPSDLADLDRSNPYRGLLMWHDEKEPKRALIKSMCEPSPEDLIFTVFVGERTLIHIAGAFAAKFIGQTMILSGVEAKIHWQHHAACTGMDMTPGERTMLVKRFEHQICGEGAINEMFKQGWRPGDHDDLIALAASQPQLGLEFDVIALGSFADLGYSSCGSSHVAQLNSHTRDCEIRYMIEDVLNGKHMSAEGGPSYSKGWPEKRLLFVKK